MDRLFIIIVLSAMVMRSFSYRIKKSHESQKAETHDASTNNESHALQIAEEYVAGTKKPKLHTIKQFGHHWAGFAGVCAFKNVYGNDHDTYLGQYDTSIDNVAECGQTCAHILKCQAFEYWDASRECKLFINSNVNSAKFNKKCACYVKVR
eukprot:TRINITY_DN24957_c0_g1_i1.p1 TRINITY_DN24957_c0_g1~~TRINITY_DN24957_c0_g1_i1.p1  ORF type:complete len:151 (-),score=26.74 TRINITY_DN24957_c0_g1_i1:84-536(-)